MDFAKATELIIQYRYFILFPLACLEGPLIALAAGFLVSLGYLQFLPAYGVLILGDLIPDAAYYFLGRFGASKKFVEKYRLRLEASSLNFAKVGRLWQDHGRKTMFFGKLAYGLSIPFLVSAGLVGMRFRRFIFLAIPVTLFQYGVIMAIGYYFGHSYQLAATYVQDAYYAIAVMVAILIAGYVLISRYAKKQFTKMERDETSAR